MSDASEIKRLTALFRKLGAPDPEGWARSQVEEGIPQLARFLFLRQAWRGVVSENDPTWIDRAIAHAEEDSDAPYAGAGYALSSLRARGATDFELTELVRAMQAELLFHIAYILGDSSDLEPLADEIRWALVQTDEDDQPIAVVDGLHESVLETDPTGREARPRRSEG